MKVQIDIPDALLPEINAFIQTQLVEISGKMYQKYADLNDLVQQNFNDGLGRYFSEKTAASQIAPLAAQITAIKNTFASALASKKPPVEKK